MSVTGICLVAGGVNEKAELALVVCPYNRQTCETDKKATQFKIEKYLFIALPIERGTGTFNKSVIGFMIF